MEKNYSDNVIYSNLDNPQRVVGFTIPEIVMVMLPILLAVFLPGLIGFLSCFLGLFLRKKYLSFNRKYPFNRLMGYKYWHLPGSKGNVLPLSFVREYVR